MYINAAGITGYIWLDQVPVINKAKNSESQGQSRALGLFSNIFPQIVDDVKVCVFGDPVRWLSD